MRSLRDQNQVFCDYPMTFYDVNATSQQDFRPSGLLQESKVDFSGKHKLYGMRVEVSVLPYKIAMICTQNYPDSVLDFEAI